MPPKTKWPERVNTAMRIPRPYLRIIEVESDARMVSRNLIVEWAIREWIEKHVPAALEADDE